MSAGSLVGALSLIWLGWKMRAGRRWARVAVTVVVALGLPVGLSFFGRAWSEPVLLKLAYGFEQAARMRREPRFLPTIKPAG